jgi:5-methylthioadenosine/S-adenosylhomocysteine deaminase
MSPTVYLDSLGMWNHGGGGFHCVHVTEEDMDVMAARGLWAVTNPGSNSKLASGIAPLVDMQKKGVNLAIGTDGPASNNCLDFFKEMFLCTSMQKLRYNDAAAMDGNTVLKMATVGGARAMGLTDCDCLSPGKQADLIVIDLAQPNMQPIHNLTKNIVYSGSKLNVKLTMIAGNILYEDGKFNVGMEAAEIYAKANEMVERVKAE